MSMLTASVRREYWQSRPGRQRAIMPGGTIYPTRNAPGANRCLEADSLLCVGAIAPYLNTFGHIDRPSLLRPVTRHLPSAWPLAQELRRPGIDREGIRDENARAVARRCQLCPTGPCCQRRGRQYGLAGVGQRAGVPSSPIVWCAFQPCGLLYSPPAFALHRHHTPAWRPLPPEPYAREALAP